MGRSHTPIRGPGGTPVGIPKGIPIWWLLLGANAFVISLPLVAFFGLRIYDTYLLRQTERQLIAQAVFVAEVWRDALAGPQRQDLLRDFRPPDKADAVFIPIEPRIDLGTTMLPPQPAPMPCTGDGSADAEAAARAVVPLIKRAQVFTLSAIRILDARGCVIGTTRTEMGESLAQLPEVRRALAGHYAAVTRERISDEPQPSLGDIRRRGNVRVFTALPVFSDGQVIGVVRISRTSLSALRSLWLNRRSLVLGALACVFFMIVASLLFAKAITRPLHRLHTDARAIVAGETSRRFAQKAWTPVEFKALAQALATMTHELRERAAYISAYTANVTHELKAPITSIRGAAELMRDGVDSMSAEQKQRFLRNIEADAVRMERLVNQLLHLARIENEAAEAEVETIDVATFFEQLMSRFPSRVSFSIDAPVTTIEMNADQLNSAVTNLIDNALEQDADSTVEVRVSRNDAQRLVIVVADDGPGIPEKRQGEIFERFFTTKKDHGGTGLGLSLVKAIAEARGGSVSVASQPGQTEFCLVL